MEIMDEEMEENTIPTWTPINPGGLRVNYWSSAQILTPTPTPVKRTKQQQLSQEDDASDNSGTTTNGSSSELPKKKRRRFAAPKAHLCKVPSTLEEASADIQRLMAAKAAVEAKMEEEKNERIARVIRAAAGRLYSAAVIEKKLKQLKQGVMSVEYLICHDRN